LLKYNNLYLAFGLGDLKNKKREDGKCRKKKKKKTKVGLRPSLERGTHRFP